MPLQLFKTPVNLYPHRSSAINVPSSVRTAVISPMSIIITHRRPISSYQIYVQPLRVYARNFTISLNRRSAILYQHSGFQRCTPPRKWIQYLATRHADFTRSRMRFIGFCIMCSLSGGCSTHTPLPPPKPFLCSQARSIRMLPLIRFSIRFMKCFFLNNSH